MIIHPFKALRPKTKYAKDIAALPYDVVTVEEAKKIAKNNPLTFLRVDLPETDFIKQPKENILYEKAVQNLQYLTKNYMIKDNQPRLYIYRLSFNGKTKTGIAGCFNICDYEQGLIKKHELTRKSKEIDRVNHITYCNAHTGPILLTFEKNVNLYTIIEKWSRENTFVYNFENEDNVTHTLWVVNEEKVIEEITNAFLDVKCLYIADGHHRVAAAASVYKSIQTQNTSRFLGVAFPKNELTILDYNRTVSTFGEYSQQEFLQEVKKIFLLESVNYIVRPTEYNTFGMYTAGKWFKLTYNKDNEQNVEIERLPSEILQYELLTPILGITDQRTDDRLNFIGGIDGINTLINNVDAGKAAVAFTLCPTTIDELIKVSDQGKIMPPKSTWFEPKLRSGLLIHSFD